MMALDLTYLHTCQANSRSANCSSVGTQLGDDAQIAATDAAFIARLHQQAAVHAAIFVTNTGRRKTAAS